MGGAGYGEEVGGEVWVGGGEVCCGLMVGGGMVVFGGCGWEGVVYGIGSTTSEGVGWAWFSVWNVGGIPHFNAGLGWYQGRW